MIVQQANWLTRSRKAAGAKGPAQAELSDDFSAQVQVADLTLPEYDFLGGVKDLVLFFNQGPVAAQFTTVSLFNPASSGVLAIVDRLSCFGSAVVPVSEGFTQVDLGIALSGNLHSADFRTTPNNPALSPIVVRTGTQVAALAPQITQLEVLGTTLEFSRSWILAPGTGYWVQANTLNIGLSGAIFFRERSAESGELGLGT